MLAKQKIIVWTMIVILFTQTLGVNTLYVLYEIDQSLFIELFCVNKDEPDLECDGTCMLAKIDDQNLYNSDILSIQNHNIIYYQLVYIIQDLDFNLNLEFGFKKPSNTSYFENLQNSLYLKNIFRPPILA